MTRARSPFRQCAANVVIRNIKDKWTYVFLIASEGFD